MCEINEIFHVFSQNDIIAKRKHTKSEFHMTMFVKTIYWPEKTICESHELLKL